MAKHDQRILKFLNQNADRAPTITEMMTRLNISISDISESVSSLQAQGLITKKVNSQGIECWFPGSAAAGHAVPSSNFVGSQMADHVPGHGTPPLAAATAQMPAMGGPIAVEARAPSEVRSSFLSGMPERGMSAPDPKPPQARPLPSAEREARPVQVQHMAAESAQSSRGLDSSDRGGLASIPQSPVLNGSPAMYGLTPSSSGVGILTLLAGLVAAVALSAFITTRLITKEMHKASTAFVDRKALTDANTAFADFQEKTKTHVAALEAEVKKLSDELAASKASVESSKVAAVAAPAAAKEAATAHGAAAATPAPAKAGKAAKIAAAKAAEAKPAKAKKAFASAKPKPSGLSAMAKAAARGAALRKKSAKPSSEASTEAGDATEGSASSGSSSSASSSSESPSVPNPPGLDDLPPPPAE